MTATIEGVAQMDLQVAGSWAGNVSGTNSGFSLPEVTGTVQLHSVRALVRGVNGPIEILSAGLQLLLEEVRVEKLSAQAGNAHWTGSMALPRGCGMPGACLVHFNLNTEEAGVAGLFEWLGPQPSQRRWYQVLTSAEPAAPTFLEKLRGSGTVNVGRLRIRNLVANHVSASLDLEHGKLKISDLRADLLGGKHRGDWQADFTAASPVYTGHWNTDGDFVGADGRGDAGCVDFRDGSGELSIQGVRRGFCCVLAIGRGWPAFDLRDGVLSHISLASDEGPLRIARWQGRARCVAGRLRSRRAS